MSSPLPSFSIIIPTYARPQQLAACLDAVDCLDYPRDRFEVIVVDDGSPSPLEAVVAPYQETLDVTLLRQPNSGPGIARNTGAARARGEFLAFTDDDCAPAAGWLRGLAARFRENPIQAVGGRTVNGLPDNLYSVASQLLVDYVYAYYAENTQYRRFFASNNLAFPTKVFLDLGGFYSEFRLMASEDREICARWQRRGYPMTYAPEAIIQHYHALTLRDFWKQHFTYGQGAQGFHTVEALRAQAKIRLEPPAFYVNMLRYPLSRAPRGRGAVVSALIGLSQAASAAGFLTERKRRKRIPA